MAFDVIFGFFLCICLYYLIASVIPFINERNDAAASRQQLQQALPNYLVYSGSKLTLTDIEITGILQQYFPYYGALNDQLKHRFLKRVKQFIKQKTFIIRSNEAFKEMPVLVSAAAIQIIFGLDRYLLPFFTYIQIYTQEYFAENALRVLAGHVKSNMITLAWNHFLKGFKEMDGSNVGLHEMAHALYYQHLIADVYKHKPFVINYEEVMQQGAETYKECRHLSNRLYSDYAFTDMQEFWAKSLEIFFENPTEMQHLYPALYKELCSLLKQDPRDALDPLRYSA
jgi:Mlc titration factor MtfA (ptsG expression regulator)